VTVVTAAVGLLGNKREFEAGGLSFCDANAKVLRRADTGVATRGCAEQLMNAGVGVGGFLLVWLILCGFAGGLG
jgi:hypothetical protein